MEKNKDFGIRKEKGKNRKKTTELFFNYKTGKFSTYSTICKKQPFGILIY